MPRRIILLTYLALHLDAVLAESNAWSCGSVDGNQHWSCDAGKGVVKPRAESTMTEHAVLQEEGLTQPSMTPPVRKSTERSKIITPLPLAPESKPELVEVQRPSPPLKTTVPNKALDPKTDAANSASNTLTCSGAKETCDGHKTSQPLSEVQDVEDDSLFTPAFSRKQEQVFSRLRQRLRADPWANCAAPSQYFNPYNNIISQPNLRDAAAMDVYSDYSEIFDKVVTSFSGNVNIKRADQHVLADQVNYNTDSDTMDAQGHVYYSEDELSLFSDSVLLNLGRDAATLRDSLFISPRSAVRGSAKVVYQEDKLFSHYKDVKYTSCPPGNQDWIIHASRFKMNKDSGKAAGTNAWLEFKGVPFFYTPYISFPIDDRRKTGFLMINPGTTNRAGFTMTLPFYWNIAPNYDALFRLRYMEKRGLMFGGDLRYMNHFSNSKLNVDVLPDDPLDLNRTRYQAGFKNHTDFFPGLTADIDLNKISDTQYFTDLGNPLSFVNNNVFVASVASLNYTSEDLQFATRFENYQSMIPGANDFRIPYRKLPQVTLNVKHDFALPVTIGSDNEFSFFQHDGSLVDNIKMVDGQRFSVKPYVTAPIQAESFFAIPKASIWHTDYILTDQYPGLASSISRTLPVLSFDSGLFAEGNVNVFGSTMTHTLEPRLFYLYVPKSNQNDIPIFDTAIFDINYDNLFKENRYTGIDRVQNANQLTIALSTSLRDNDSGLERLKLRVGDVIHFTDREAQSVWSVNYPNIPNNGIGAFGQITPIPASNNLFSDVVSELSGQLTQEVSFTSGVLWDPYANDLVRKQIALHYKDQNGFIFNVGYLQRKNYFTSFAPNVPFLIDNQWRQLNSNDDAIKAGDISFRIPIYDNWRVIGRWQYSFLNNVTTESFLGLEKESCCWRFRLIGRHFINGVNLTAGTTGPLLDAATIDRLTSNTVLFEIELKNLSAFGDDVDTFLKRNIYGYN